MHLTQRERMKLDISVAAMVARRRLERGVKLNYTEACLLYTSPSPRDRTRSRMPSSA